MFLSAFALLRSTLAARAYYQCKHQRGNATTRPPSPYLPPHPDPARHDPQRFPLRSTTIGTVTRSRLTHHIRPQDGRVQDTEALCCSSLFDIPITKFPGGTSLPHHAGDKGKSD